MISIRIEPINSNLFNCEKKIFNLILVLLSKQLNKTSKYILYKLVKEE